MSDQPVNFAKRVGAIVFFMVTSISAVLLNKAILKNDQFPCPLLATSIQFLVACIILVAIFLIGRFHPPLRVFESLEWRYDVAVSVFPVSFMFMGMVCLNNWFLMWSSVGFYAIGKSFTIPMSVAMSYLILGASSSLKTIMACVVVSAGILVGSYFNVELEWKGLLLGFMSSLFTAGYQIAVKRGMQTLGGDQWKMSFYNSVWVVVLLTPVAIFSGEADVARNALLKDGLLDWTLVGALTLTGIVGFLIGQATYLSIHYTSALAHHVTGAVKSGVQTGLGILFFSESATPSGLAGLGLTLAGSYLFMMARMEPPKTMTANGKEPPV